MKKIFNKVGQVLQLLLAAPVKLPGKVGNVLKYLALGLGIVETVLLDEAKPQSEVDDGKTPQEGKDNPDDGERNQSALDDTMSAAVSPTAKDASAGGMDNGAVKNGSDNTVERSAMDESE